MQSLATLTGITFFIPILRRVAELRGDGAAAVWSLGGVGPGTYTVTVEVDDGCGCMSFSSRDVTVGG